MKIGKVLSIGSHESTGPKFLTEWIPGKQVRAVPPRWS
jgi:hypothetical protein